MRNQGKNEASAIRLKVVSPGNLVDVRRAYAKETHLIGGLDFSLPLALSIYVFDTRNSSLRKGVYSHISYPIFSCFNHFSAYCNGADQLFISGGDMEKIESSAKIGRASVANDVLCSINLMNVPGKLFVRRLTPLKHRRSWHSMVFIPDRYIYIIGGVQTHSVEVHDIKNNTTTIDSKMCRNRCEAAVAVVNTDGSSFLYACFGFNRETGRFNADVERMDLYAHPHRWDLINLALPSSFLPSFFSVSLLSQNSLLLLGGKESVQEYPSYILTPEANAAASVTAAAVAPPSADEIFVFKEKFLLPFDEKNAAVLVMKRESVDNARGSGSDLCGGISGLGGAEIDGGVCMEVVVVGMDGGEVRRVEY